MTIEHLRGIVARLQVSAGALAALVAILDARMSDQLPDPCMRSHLDDIATALELPAAMKGVDPVLLGPVMAEVRTFALQNAALIFSRPLSPGWTHTDVEMLQAAGEASAGVGLALRQNIAPRLDGLLPRLESADATFLDIGVGVGALSIGMARQWPLLRIVGIDPWEPALALARENIKAAGLTQRVELRRQRVEELRDSQAFDLAWLPGVFIPEDAIDAALVQLHEALRPGGWLLVAMLSLGSDPLTVAMARLRTALFGGSLMSTEAIETKLRQAGFADVRALVSPATATVTMIAARRGHE